MFITDIFENTIRLSMLKSIASLTNDYDLRNIEGYDQDATMFILPHRVIRAVASIIANKVEVPNPSNVSYIFLVLALSIPPQNAFDVRRYLKTQKLELSTALENVEKAFANGWDTASIKRKIISIFS
jgi:hypothetical protein